MKVGLTIHPFQRMISQTSNLACVDISETKSPFELWQILTKGPLAQISHPHPEQSEQPIKLTLDKESFYKG